MSWAWSQAEWYGPAAGQLDPRKEAEAAVIRVEQGFSSRARETAELTGSDWNRIHHVRVREERLRREGGVVFERGVPQPPTQSSAAQEADTEDSAQADAPPGATPSPDEEE